MSDLNLIILTGNIGKDPEVRVATSGKPVATVSLATNRQWNQDGERKKETQWHRIVFFGKLAEICRDHVVKGSRINVVGELKHRSYEQDGVKKYITEVVVAGFQGQLNFEGSKPNAGDTQNAEQTRVSNGTQQQPQAEQPGGDPWGDDIPF